MKKLEIVKQAKIINIIVASLLSAAGIVFLIVQDASVDFQKYLWGGLFLITGAAKLLGYYSNDMYRLAFQFDFAIGILSIILGLCAVCTPTTIMSIFPIIIGVYILVDGLLKLQTAFDAKRFGIDGWSAILATAALLALCGLFVIISHQIQNLSPQLILAAALIVEGISNIWITAYTVKVRTTKKNKLSGKEKV